MLIVNKLTGTKKDSALPRKSAITVVHVCDGENLTRRKQVEKTTIKYEFGGSEPEKPS